MSKKNTSKGKKESAPATDRKLEKTTTMLRYNFTKQELEERSQQLAEALKKRSAKEEELRQIKSDYKAQFDELDNNIRELSNNITEKYEMRNTPCFLHKNFKTKERQYIDADGTVLKIESLTTADYQLAIDNANQ